MQTLEKVICKTMNRYSALQKIVEFVSFTKAAEALGYTQSAMSQMISSLEDELSIKLLYRSRVGVKLTLEGANLYSFIQRTILQYQALQEKANEIKGLETGVIRIGTISSISCHWMPQLIREFQCSFHDLRHDFAQGKHPKDVQYRLGHSSISMTLDTYTHHVPTRQNDIADWLETPSHP